MQTNQKAAVRGAVLTLVVTSTSKELNVIDVMSMMNKVIMPGMREPQKLGIVKTLWEQRRIATHVNHDLRPKNCAGVQHLSQAGSGQVRRRREERKLNPANE